MPRINLTTQFLDALKPTDRRINYTDTIVRGLTLRVSETGVKTWSLRYRPNGAGRQQRLTLGVYPDLKLKAARKRAESERGDIADGADPAVAKQEARRAAQRTGDTIGDLAKDYIAKHAKPLKRSWQDDDRMLAAEVLPHWKSTKVAELTRRDVRALLEAIVERGSPITANRCLSLIRKMLNFGIQQDWIDANVAAQMPKPGGDESGRARERVLTPEEIRRVWAACETERTLMCALLRLRLLTAQRGGELAALEWSDVDLETGWITIPAALTKNKQPHRVPLTKPALAILTAIPRIEDSPYVFPGRPITQPMGDAKKGGMRIAAVVLATLQESDATVKTFDFRGHDLRRTASTYMAEAGIDPMTIARVLNHVDGTPRATKIYNRYQYDAEKRVALEAWARRLTAILKEKSAPAAVPFVRRSAK